MGNAIFNGVCVLVTAAFALTLVPGFRQPERSLLSRRDQGTVLLVFLVLGLVEEVTVSHAGWLNERIFLVRPAAFQSWRSLQLTLRASSLTLLLEVSLQDRA